MPRKISAKKIKDLCNIALDDLKAVDINAFDVEKTSSFASWQTMMFFQHQMH